MIQNSKQTWEIGKLVNVGFMRNLRVMEKIPTPGNYAPDAYILRNDDSGSVYRFVPHKGIERVS